MLNRSKLFHSDLAHRDSDTDKYDNRHISA